MCESIVVVGAALSADVDAPTERVHSAPGARRGQSPKQPTGERAGRENTEEFRAGSHEDSGNSPVSSCLRPTARRILVCSRPCRSFNRHADRRIVVVQRWTAVSLRRRHGADCSVASYIERFRDFARHHACCCAPMAHAGDVGRLPRTLQSRTDLHRPVHVHRIRRRDARHSGHAGSAPSLSNSDRSAKRRTTDQQLRGVCGEPVWRP